MLNDTFDERIKILKHTFETCLIERIKELTHEWIIGIILFYCKIHVGSVKFSG